MGENSFGAQLRYFRRQSRDPKNGGPFTQDRLANLLNDMCSLPYSSATISDWERGKSQIPKDNRETLVGLILVLGTHGGVLSLVEANSWLESGNYRLLNEQERINLQKAEISWHDLALQLEGVDQKKLFLAPPLPFQAITGRDGTLKNIKQRLVDRDTVTLSAVRGLPGVGKTTVALALAHDRDIRESFPDGVFWVGLGRDPDVFFHLGLWAQALGIKPDEISKMDTLGKRCSAIRSYLSNRKALLIIDDVWQVRNASWFRLGSQDCAHIVTTRQTRIANEFINALQVIIDALDFESSVRLLNDLAPQVYDESPKAIRKLAQLSTGLPLTLVLMGNHLRKIAATGQKRRIEQALDDLQNQDFRLKVSMPQSGVLNHPSLSHEQTISLNNIIGISEQALPDDMVRYSFFALGFFPPKPSSFSEAAILETMGASLETLDEIVDSGLIESSGQARYQIHQSVADYIQGRPSSADTRQRFVSYYKDWLEKEHNSYEKVESELENIFYAATEAKASSLNEAFVSMAKNLYPFLEKRGLWDHVNDLLPDAIELAEKLSDYKSVISLCRNFGRAQEQQRHFEKAKASWNKAIKLAQEQKDIDNVVSLSCELSLAISDSGENKEQAFKEANIYLDNAQEIAEAAHHSYGVCLVHAYRGRLYNISGKHNLSPIFLDKAIQIAAENEFSALLSGLFNLRGVAAQHSESLKKAKHYYSLGLKHARNNKRKDQIGLILTNLGEIETLQGNNKEASFYLEEALLIIQELKNQAREAHILKDLGTLASNRGETELSYNYFERALTLAKADGDKWLISYIRVYWGESALNLKDYAIAENLFTSLINQLPITDDNPRTDDELYIVGIAKFGLAQIALFRKKPNYSMQLARRSRDILGDLNHVRAEEVQNWIQSLFNNLENETGASF